MPEIWLAGKGPSLMTYDWTKAGKFRIGINHAASFIPKCYGAIALDYSALDYYKKYLSEDVIVYRKRVHIEYVFKNMVLWDKTQVPDLYATSIAAVQLFYSYGCRTMHMVGFDAVDGDFGRPQKLIDLSGIGNVARYEQISEKLMEIIAGLKDLKIIWEHRND